MTASGSIFWQDSQHVILDITGNARIQDEVTELSTNCGLVSSVHTIQYITFNLTHTHMYANHADSQVLIKYHPDKVIEARSTWLLDNSDDHISNITGNLQLVSPVINYRRSDLKCHLSLRSDWKFYGVANLDLDKIMYTGHLTGNLEKLKESMVSL